MKKLLLLLFIPFVSFSHSFKNVVSVNSIDDFKRVAIEKGYELYEEDDSKVLYAYNIVKEEGEEDIIERALAYFKGTNTFMFTISKQYSLLGKTITMDNTLYDEIVDEIKTKCTYNKIERRQNELDFVTYKCSEDKGNFTIGFAIKDGWGMITSTFDGDYKKVDKRKKQMELNASKYNLNSNKVGGGNYNLAGRNALSKPIEQPNCEEEGTVVVSIEVDKYGTVLKAVSGVKGTTNSANCLLKPAREAALRTTWNPDPNAPSVQKGNIIYKFSLTN